MNFTVLYLAWLIAATSGYAQDICQEVSIAGSNSDYKRVDIDPSKTITSIFYVNEKCVGSLLPSSLFFVVLVVVVVVVVVVAAAVVVVVIVVVKAEVTDLQ
ncbi:hypothetical protein ElyMa_003481700 [Elysia marginata]|uniref:Uncharacterized protein n=1 Tax=Elysia marginata TaxID=1093978 RepID=A0AAV4EBS0_9GAST|nr:hypothetical protein ElyMa_003481700 [Elysia marginata]